MTHRYMTHRYYDSSIHMSNVFKKELISESESVCTDQSADLCFEWSTQQLTEQILDNASTRQSLDNPRLSCVSRKESREEKGKIDPFFEQPTSIADIEPTLTLTSNDPGCPPAISPPSAQSDSPRCDICDKRFVNEHEYSQHCKIHQKTSNQTNPHKCAKCGKILASKRTLKSHRNQPSLL